MLLIDDEPLLAVTAEVLLRLGYEPVSFSSFSDSRAALAAFEAAPERFDVVVTDEVMPGLTGTGLARVLHHLRPGLPFVLVSGYGGVSLTRARSPLASANCSPSRSSRARWPPRSLASCTTRPNSERWACGAPPQWHS